MIGYKKYQSNRSGATKGKWYAKAVTRDSLSLENLAEHMSNHNSSFSKGQILAVLTDMTSCVKELCLESKKVKIDNLGIFYPSLSSKGAVDEKSYTPAYIKGVRIRCMSSGDLSTSTLNAEAKHTLSSIL